MSGAVLSAVLPPADALARTRRLATVVLGLMAAIFAATHVVPDGTLARLVRAMAEAGMIGGLADWFAVEALFRHPLGLPIPHTALLPKNQARAARNVGRFLEAHFLEPSSLEPRLRALGLGRHALDWLARPGNASLVGRELTTLLGSLLQHDLPPRMLARARLWLRAQVRRAEADGAIADGLARMVKEGVRSRVAGEVVLIVRRAIDENRDVALRLVQDRSRWWIAPAVDRQVAGIIVDGILGLLDDLGREGSDMRREFETAVDGMVDSLAAEGTLIRAVSDGRQALVDSGIFDRVMLGFATGLRDRLRDRLVAEPEALAEPLADLIRDLTTRTGRDDAMSIALDARVAEIGARLIGEMRPAIGDYVADVIASWEPLELNARFEAEIGPDLHYIRINGAVLGALIGGALFGLNSLIG